MGFSEATALEVEDTFSPKTKESPVGIALAEDEAENELAGEGKEVGFGVGVWVEVGLLVGVGVGVGVEVGVGVGVGVGSAAVKARDKRFDSLEGFLLFPENRRTLSS